MEDEIIKVDLVDPFDKDGVDWLLVCRVVSRIRVLHLLVSSVQIFLHRLDPPFEPLFRYITGDLAEDVNAVTIRIRVAVVVIDEVAALGPIHFVSAGAHERRKQRQGSLSLLLLYTLEVIAAGPGI